MQIGRCGARGPARGAPQGAPRRPFGYFVIVNDVELVAVPLGVVTAIGPVLAPPGTLARTCVSESTAKLADFPLNVTRVVPLRLVPLIVTVVFTRPEVGVKLVTVGAAVDVVTVKLVELVAVPFVVVTETGPLDAPLGTVVVIDESDVTVNVADVPLNRTADAPVKPVPVIVTEVPAVPLVGENDEIVGPDGGGGVPLQPGSSKEPMRVCQLFPVAPFSVVGVASCTRPRTRRCSRRDRSSSRCSRPSAC